MRKYTKIIVMLGAVWLTSGIQIGHAQDENKTTKYRRSSLHMVLIETNNFPRKETVVKAYATAPFPDKYNNHSLDNKSLDPQKYPISDADRKAAGTDKSAAGKLIGGAKSDATGGIIDKNETDYPLIIDKYIKDKKVANQLVAKWFNRKSDGTFDMNLIAERGYYSASDMEANIASKEKKGRAVLADAGEELLKNTFVVFSKMNFISNEIVARGIRDVAKAEAAKNIKMPMLLDKANKVADALYEKTKEGYTVWTTSYLYRLKWNDSVASIFYNNLWIDNKNPDPKKKAAFDEANLFELELVGDEKSNSLVLFSLKEKRTEDQIIEIATVRNIDAVYAKLQKSYEVFRPKVPLFSVDPITAKIGMKEGLEGGEKFEVLEQTLDPETGLTEYKKKGTIKLDAELVWDNRYNAGEAPVAGEVKEGEAQKPVLDRSTFSGKAKNLYSGMLIRQLN